MFTDLTQRVRTCYLLIGISCLLSIPTHSLALDWLSGGDSKNLWHFRNEQYVRLEVQQDTRQPNQHPVTLDTAQLRTILASLQVDYKGTLLPAFVFSELDIIVEPLQRGLSKAAPNEDVTFAVLGMHPGIFANENRLVTGRVFYENNQLHIIFGALQAAVDYHEDRRIKPFLAGTRQTAQTFERALQLTPGQQFVGNRQDWVALDIERVMMHIAEQADLQPAVVAAETAKVQEQAAQLEREVQILRQEVATLKYQDTPPAVAPMPQPVQPETAALQDAVSELQQEVKALKTQPAAPTAASTTPSNEIEARLQLLKDLRAKDLITEQEYQQKRQQILDNL